MINNSDNGIVLSSRIRLARNVEGFPYPSKLNDERGLLIARKVYDAVNKMANYELYRMASTSEIDANVLKEKHLISVDLLHNNQYGAAIINENETVSIMINEEDHVREQCILKGFQFENAYRQINEVDDEISKNMRFSFDSKLGYLTSCPTNLGTGMRASAMMFLPGLTITKSLEACVNAVARLNMTIRGVYGEGSGADGFMYQVSNQHTLGITEQEIIDSVTSSINHLVDAEQRARQSLFENNTIELKDQILRAWGLLTSAYKMESKEFMELMAYVKLGIYYDIIKVTDFDRLTKLITDAQPANILNISGKDLNSEERDIYRAQYVAKTLKAIGKK